MANNIYTTLISDIKTTLESVAEVKAVYGYPVSRVEKYPAVVFIPDEFDNEFDTNQENMEIRRFRMIVVINATQTNLENVFTDYMPKTVDAIRAKFAKSWETGDIAGNWGWYKIDSGQWNVGETDKGLEVWCELFLDVKLLTNN